MVRPSTWRLSVAHPARRDRNRGGHIERSFDTSRTLTEGGYGNSVGELRRAVDALAALLASEVNGSPGCEAPGETTKLGS